MQEIGAANPGADFIASQNSKTLRAYNSNIYIYCVTYADMRAIEFDLIFIHGVMHVAVAHV